MLILCDKFEQKKTLSEREPLNCGDRLHVGKHEEVTCNAWLDFTLPARCYALKPVKEVPKYLPNGMSTWVATRKEKQKKKEGAGLNPRD